MPAAEPQHASDEHGSDVSTLTCVVLAGPTTALIIAPVAWHRVVLVGGWFGFAPVALRRGGE